METLPFELGPIRPVDEADSLLIRTTRGCPWNNCEFCVNYKGMRFSKRSIADIKKDIEAAAAYYGGHPFRSRIESTTPWESDWATTGKWMI